MRASFLIIFLFFGFNFYNCTSSDCEFGPVVEFFDISGFNQVNHVTSDFSYLQESVDIAFEEYSYMEVRYQVVYISNLIRPSSLINIGWTSTLYACSPPWPGYNGSKDEAYSQIDIITQNDYNDTIRAGDNINHLIEFSDPGSFEGFLSLEDYLASIVGNVPNEFIYLRPTIRPSSGEDFQLNIQVELSTGESIQTVTPAVTFK